MPAAVRHAAWGSAVLAPVALIGGWTIAATRQPASYDATRDTISALAAHDASDRWLMTTALVVLGLCHVVTALGFAEARRSGRLVLALGGVAAIGVAVFAQPSRFHYPVAAVSFVLLAVWSFVADVPGRRSGRGVAVALVALLLVFTFGFADGPTEGLWERVLAGAEALWPLGALVLARRQPARVATSITKR